MHPKESPKPKKTSISEETPNELDVENSLTFKDLDRQSWNSIFNSLKLSMFVSQVFSEFEFVSFINNIDP